MKYDVFLYGRTKKYDYFDMYVPSWLTYDTDEYLEYRRTVSFIMKIRDILPEEKSGVLRNTQNSFIFYRGLKINMLCRFCHASGEDEFGRPICSTEGFICKSNELKDFWISVPDMIAHMTAAEKTFYDEYASENGSSSKPPQLTRNEEISCAEETCVPSKQFEALKKAVAVSKQPFSFAFGTEKKEFYDYGSADDMVKINIFFAADECTEIPEEPEIKSEADFGEFCVYVDIRKSSQNRLRYRLAVGSKPTADRKVKEIPYVSYERENGTEIKMHDLFAMYEAVKMYISEHGIGQTQRKCIPFNSDIDCKYTGKNARIEYMPSPAPKKNILNMLKGVKNPDFIEYTSLKCENRDEKITELFEIYSVPDDTEARLINYDKIMEEVT